MHDIGKIGISNDIVLKSGKLTANEFEIMKNHCEIGRKIIGEHGSSLLKAAQIVAYEHHERWDGKGYPRGIAGEDIHLFSRIAAVADVFDALVSKRSYKKAWTFTEACNYIVEQSGGHFDPTVVTAFVKGMDQIKEIVNQYNRDKSNH
jgi:putative two-component system response regulator